MDRNELKAELRRSETSMYRLAKDLGLANSTTVRWGASVPRYAAFYALALAEMTEEQRERVRRRLAEATEGGHATEGGRTP